MKLPFFLIGGSVWNCKLVGEKSPTEGWYEGCITSTQLPHFSLMLGILSAKCFGGYIIFNLFLHLPLFAKQWTRREDVSLHIFGKMGSEGETCPPTSVICFLVDLRSHWSFVPCTASRSTTLRESRDMKCTMRSRTREKSGTSQLLYKTHHRPGFFLLTHNPSFCSLLFALTNLSS